MMKYIQAYPIFKFAENQIMTKAYKYSYNTLENEKEEHAQMIKTKTYTISRRQLLRHK